jgi:hypothetical protein
MLEVAVSTLTEWESFYVIVGSSAAALTGLQFVVIALTADFRRSSTREINAFATPTIIHFGAVLLLSGILTAPWRGLWIPALLMAASGVAGCVYTILVVRRARGQTSYRLVVEDWVFHAALPAIAYALLAAAALMLRLSAHRALFVIATAALLLLFIGIHNAWDTATYVVVTRDDAPGEESAKAHADPVVPPS